jgi:hypothetical protein
MAQQRRTNALAQAAMGRGGSGGNAAGGIAAAMQQFMATFGQAMNKMTKGIQQSHEQLAQESQQHMANIANVAEQTYNQAQRQAEQQHQEARQDAATENARAYQLKLADYQDALQRNVEKDARTVALLMKEQAAAAQRVLETRERNVATINNAREPAYKQLLLWDAQNAWDVFPDGPERRKELYDLNQMARMVSSDYLDSPYDDRLHAGIAKTLQDLSEGKPEYQSYIGVEPPPPMIPVPASMVESLKLKLPILSQKEANEWKNRNGYPKGGVWAMKTDDPKLLLVNPVSFSVLLQARQEDTFLAMTQSREARMEYIMGLGKAQMARQEWAKPLEEAQTKLTEQFEGTVPDAINGVLTPATLHPGQLGAQAPAGADPMSVLGNVYKSVLRANPDLADKAMRLGLPDGDPEKWVPGQKKDETKDEAIQDFYAAQQIQAAKDVIARHLEQAQGDSVVRGNVEQWLNGLTEAQVHQVGMTDDVASAVAETKRRSMTIPPDIARRAVSQVISKWSEVNYEQVGIPVDNNTVMTTWRNDNHHAELMQDALATTYALHMTPDEVHEMQKTGTLPAVLEESFKGGGRPGVSITDPNIMRGVVELFRRPGSRKGLNEVLRGGFDPEDAKVLSDPEYNKVVAYYEAKAMEQKDPNGQPKPNLYMGVVERLHADRARAKAAMAQPSPQETGGGYGVAGEIPGIAKEAGKRLIENPLRAGKAAMGLANRAMQWGVGQKGMETLGMPSNVNDQTSQDITVGPDQLAPQPQAGPGE